MRGSIGEAVRRKLTRERLRDLMAALADSAPRGKNYRVYLVGGGTAVHAGWRDATIDADLHADDDGVFRDIQAIKERLQLNVEFARPEDFVPPLAGSEQRHVFIDAILRVSFYHHDPYAQLLSKIVRGFRQDMQDAASFIESGMVDPAVFKALVHEIPPATYARYPALTRRAVLDAVEAFLVR